MKIINCVQGSPEWMLARAGIPTASEFHNLLTPKFEIRKGKTPETYLAQKVAERWEHGPLIGFSSFATEAGHIVEGEARSWYEFEFGETVQTVGLVTTDDGLVGCSPDGLIGDDGGIEIKSPQSVSHVKYLQAGVVPEDYIVQLYGALYVSGRKWWNFLSYRRGYPPLLLQVYRDDAIMKAIDSSLRDFRKKMEELYAHLVKLNGGNEPLHIPVNEPLPEGMPF